MRKNNIARHMPGSLRYAPAPLVIALVVALIGGGIWYGVSYFNSDATAAGCTVTDTHKSYGGRKSGVRRYVETKECGKFKANHSVYNAVQVGKTYDFKVRGFETVISYRTIYEAVEAK